MLTARNRIVSWNVLNSIGQDAWMLAISGELRPLPSTNIDGSLFSQLLHLSGKYLDRYPVDFLKLFSRTQYTHDLFGSAHTETFFTSQLSMH